METKLEPRQVWLPAQDPRRKSKQAAFEFFECGFLKEAALAASACHLSDLSGLPASRAASFAKQLKNADAILIQPGSLQQGAFSALKLVESRPLRAWAMAAKLREFRLSGVAGELCSFRVFWEWPHKAKQPDLKTSLLPDLLDLCEFVGGAPVSSLQVSPWAKGAFVLATLEGNVVAEINVNQALPASLAPQRFIHAYFTKGALGNLPLYGYENDEGMLVADAKGARHELAEHVNWGGVDEWDDFYLRMIGAIFDGTFGDPCPRRQDLFLSAIQAAWKSGEPAEIGSRSGKGGRP